LENLHIANTDIDKGVIDLPNSIKEINYSSEERQNCGVSKIKKELDSYLTKKKLAEKYPNKGTTHLDDLHYESLKGCLDLSGYDNLELLYCQGNQLTDIILPKNPTKLKTLYLSDNNFPKEKDLSFLENCTSLEALYLGNNDKEKIDSGIYNKFSGSLKFLHKLTNLKTLHISNTDIEDENLDCLLKSSVKEIYCSNGEREVSKVEEIEKSLKELEKFSFDSEGNKYVKKDYTAQE